MPILDRHTLFVPRGRNFGGLYTTPPGEENFSSLQLFLKIKKDEIVVNIFFLVICSPVEGPTAQKFKASF